MANRRPAQSIDKPASRIIIITGLTALLSALVSKTESRRRKGGETTKQGKSFFAFSRFRAEEAL
ncbi:hypothetical protein ACLOJK_006239 [Asimina triloba]